MNGVVTDIILVIGFIKNTIDRIKGFDEALGETTKYMTTLQITIQNVANENRMSGFDDVLNQVTDTLNDVKDDIDYVSESKGCSIKSAYELGVEKGYKMICHCGNVIFVRNDLINKLPDYDYNIETLYQGTSFDFNNPE